MSACVVAGVNGSGDIGEQDVTLLMLDAEGLSGWNFRYGGDPHKRVWHNLLV